MRRMIRVDTEEIFVFIFEKFDDITGPFPVHCNLEVGISEIMKRCATSNSLQIQSLLGETAYHNLVFLQKIADVTHARPYFCSDFIFLNDRPFDYT